MTGIFISYREAEAKAWALLLRDELVEAFGEAQVFLDKDTLRAGSWRQQLEAALDRCGVVLVVMGPNWLNATDSHGKRRLDDPGDVHRQEIAAALARKDVTVIPVRVDGASMPQRDALPEDIRTLVEQQARALGDSSAHRALDVRALVADIERLTGLVAVQRVSPAPPPVVPSLPSGRTLLMAGAVSLVALVFAELQLGWGLDAREKLFVVLVVLTLTVSLRWARVRSKGETRAN